MILHAPRIPSRLDDETLDRSPGLFSSVCPLSIDFHNDVGLGEETYPAVPYVLCDLDINLTTLECMALVGKNGV